MTHQIRIDRRGFLAASSAMAAAGLVPVKTLDGEDVPSWRCLEFPRGEPGAWLWQRKAGEDESWSYLGLAGGRVVVPAGIEIRLVIDPSGSDHLSHLSHLRDGDVQAIDVAGCAFGDADLRKLAKLPRLQEMNLAGTQVTAVGLDRLPAWHRLASLILSRLDLTGRGLAQLPALDGLKVLNLSGALVAEDTVRFLCSHFGIRNLNIAYTAVDDRAICRLIEGKDLHDLNVSGTNMSDGSLKQIGRLPRLRSLDASGTRMLGTNFVSAPHLVELNLSHTSISHGFFIGTGRWRGLERLRLQKVSSISKSAKCLRHLTNLAFLDLHDNQLTSRAIIDLRQLENLKILDLGSSPYLTDQALKELENWTALKSLSVSSPWFSKRARSNLRKALPDCRIAFC